MQHKIPFPWDVRQKPHPVTGAVWTRLPQGATQRSEEEQTAHRNQILQSRRARQYAPAKTATPPSANTIALAPATQSAHSTNFEDQTSMPHSLTNSTYFFAVNHTCTKSQ